MIYIVNLYILLVYVQLVISIRSRLLKQCWPQYPGFTHCISNYICHLESQSFLYSSWFRVIVSVLKDGDEQTRFNQNLDTT